MALIETRGRAPKYTWPDLEVGEYFSFTAEGRNVKDGKASYVYANLIDCAYRAYLKRRGLDWKIARRVVGLEVQIHRIA